MSLDTVIKQIRSRAQAHHEYLSKGERETRTKYALIDPILRSLGWDTEDPNQVKMEYEVDPGREDGRRVDYALFRDGCTSKPYMLIEAKGLMSENAENARNLSSNLTNLESDRTDVWKAFSEGALTAFDDSHMTAKYEDGGMFPGLKKQHLAQLSGYTRAFDMDQGYGVTTNGDAWVIYDLSLPGGIDEEPIGSISLLNIEDSIYDCVNTLNILRRRF
ncbi:MAG: hypothetical protein OXC95_00950 [Dehalococcoidia bacterium]|nr:hypothetical protein [Dehalococcoidia bacterium]